MKGKFNIKFNIKKGLQNSVVTVLVIVFLSSSLLIPLHSAKAQYMVLDPMVYGAVIQGIIRDTIEHTTTVAKEITKETILKALRTAALVAVKTAGKKVAYDTATYIASGGRGQNLKFRPEDWQEYTKNTLDEAGGYFLESLGKKWGVNVCKPSLEVQVSISSGIKKQIRPGAPDCTITEMKKNWDEELKRTDFLNRFQTSFEPTSNDFGIALTLQTNMMEEASKKYDAAELERLEEGGWKWARDMAGNLVEVPNLSENSVFTTLADMYNKMNLQTDNAVADIINTFTSQFMITYFKRMLGQFDSASLSSSGSGGGTSKSISEIDSASYVGGTTAAKEQFGKILQLEFGGSGDYLVLAGLSSCNDPTDAGPSECVIDEGFRTAVENKITVGEALKKGYLKSQGIFGFDSNGSEPTYNQGYPYRSMVILRKYRIIPVGWELAAQYINDNLQEGAKNLGDLVACFDSDDDYEGYYSAWCGGLVDPDWVLKAPLNYCKKKGPGPQIMSSDIIASKEFNEAETDTIDKNEIMVMRNDDYCADEQTCIKENNDGSCKLYGYCTEDERKWVFDEDSCDPIYNTCETFKNSNGSSISLLKNTLDHSICNADNAGCRSYSSSYSSYDTDNDILVWNEVNSIYFSSSVEKCDQTEDGCHEFIRTKEGLGTNLIQDSSFEEETIGASVSVPTDYGIIGEWFLTGVTATVVDSNSGQVHSGEKSLRIEGSNGLYSYDFTRADRTVMPTNFYFQNDYAYTLSAWVYVNSGNVRISMGNNATGWDHYIDSTKTGEWERLVLTVVNDSSIDIEEFFVYGQGTNPDFYVDDIKLEIGQNASIYSGYRDRGLVYEKILPDYLYDLCYEDADGDLFIEMRDSAPVQCGNYARRCNEQEVDCELYTSTSDGISIPAKIKAQDYCRAECVGYDTYLQSETYFENQEQNYFIPDLAQKCSAEQVGCEEFTNLDTIDEGGEGREYYTYLKQCRLPDNQCAEFYTWEGDSETGYQLKVYSLEMVLGSAANPEPSVFNAVYEGMGCDSEADYDLEENPMCREFYNTNGDIFYKFLPYVKTCSEDCHPFRRTNTDNPGGNLCLNGGVWNNEQGCIYMAIPKEGKKCSASQVGCREYSGNSGSNMRVVLNDGFEAVSSLDWAGGIIESESLKVGEHSLSVSAAPYEVSKTIGNLAHQGSSYSLSFFGKPLLGSVDISVSIGHGATSTSFVGTVSLSPGEWEIYELNMPNLDHVVSVDEEIVIVGTGRFYIDNIKLTEITDRYFLIKDSWQMPTDSDGRDVCNWDLIDDESEALYSLGCDEYTDRANMTYYLRQFDQLCQDSAVGCELVVDTHNYSNFSANAWNDGGDGVCDVTNGEDCIEVQEDNIAYIVYDQEKECARSDKGCERFGAKERYEDQVVYSDVYFRNNLDLYETILCSEEEDGCEEWDTNEGYSYFKDPGNHICEWRQRSNSDDRGWAWYKQKVKRCDEDENGYVDQGDDVCVATNDCASGSCILDENDYECEVDLYKTFGEGGRNFRVAQPTMDSDGIYWAGLCPAKQSGCTEYIDPVSKFSANLLFNSSFSDIDGNASGGPDHDGWSVSGTSFYQQIGVKPYALYRLFGEYTTNPLFLGDRVTLECDNNIFTLNSVNNELVVNPGGDTYVLNINNSDDNSALLYTSNNTNCQITVNGYFVDVQFKEVIVDYQLELDKINNCNGIVNFDEGCVLFNERSQEGASKTNLVYNANLSPGIDGAPVSCFGVDCNANVVINVSPDRECAQWLACKNFVKDNDGNVICYDIGLCESVDDNGECNGFVLDSEIFNSEEAKNQTYPTVLSKGDISNLSGYSSVGYETLNSQFAYKNLFPFSVMEQVGSEAKVVNGSFEINEYREICNSTGYKPDGWSRYDSVSWCPANFSAINDPIIVQKRALGYKEDIYAPEGKSFLEFNSGDYEQAPFSGLINVQPGTDYIISAYVNSKDLSSNDENYDVSAHIDLIPFNSDGVELSEAGIYNYNYMSDSRNLISVDSSRDWRLYVTKFRTNSSVASVKIRLNGYTNGVGECGLANTHCTGSIYVDDIKIQPALKTRDLTPNVAMDDNYWYETQTCRLYPDNKSLSCDYYEDSGLRKTGWSGYCLEYDRYPGNENACLLWYPVDRVKGDNIADDEISYDGRFPLYYATEFQYINNSVEIDYMANSPDIGYLTSCVDSLFDNDRTNEDSASHTWNITIEDISYQLETEGRSWQSQFLNSGLITSISFDGYDDPLRPTDAGAEGYATNIWFNCCSYRCCAWCTHSKAVFNSNNSLDVLHLSHTSSHSHNGDYITDKTVTINFRIPYASRIVKVIDDNGGGSVWQGRISESSDYQSVCSFPPFGNLICMYNTDYYPYGSIVYPTPPEDPSLWDSKEAVGGQPLFFEPADNSNPMLLPAPYQPRAGKLHTRERLQRLFARGYEEYRWNGSNYVLDSSSSWSPPSNLCSGGTRPIYDANTGLCDGGDCFSCPSNTCDFCGVPPIVSNVQINGRTSNIVFSQSQYANLTFNSDVDTEQLPLARYIIDWGEGDDSITDEGNLRLRDRPNAEDPHSFFHLYNYWFMKNNEGEGTIECIDNCFAGGAGWSTNPNDTMACCRVKPSVKIQDNWGWCSDGYNGVPCPTGGAEAFEDFSGYVVVTER